MNLHKTLIFILIIGQHFFVPYIITSQNVDFVKKENLLKLDGNSYLLKSDTTFELLQVDKSLDIWKLNEYIEILTFNNNSLRFWKQGNNASLWIFDQEIKDWKLNNEVTPGTRFINDSITVTDINDTIKLVYFKNVPKICNSNKNIFVWKNIINYSQKVINDTINLYSINDTVNLWINKDSSALWQLNNKPKLWRISSSTKVWTLNANTEFWKAGANYNVWNRKTLKDQWQIDQKMIPKPLDSLFQIWTPSDSVMIWSAKDTIQIWQITKKKKIWSLNDSLKVWTVPPPRPKPVEIDTIIPPIRMVKKAELLDIDDSFKLWSINDTTKLFYTNGNPELWKKNQQVKLWKISDSALIWNINQKIKLTYINDSLTIWLKNDSTFEWKIDISQKQKKISENLIYLNINDSVRFTKHNDTSLIWNSSKAARIATRTNVGAFLILNDTIEFWEPNDSTKLWINKYDEKGQIWEKNKQVNILNINDSTKIWQINENVRLSIINGKLKIWQQGDEEPDISWKESRKFKNERINDSIKIWHINNKTVIWETKQRIEVWNLNKNLELLRLNDTSLIWTYSASLIPPYIPKPKFWKITGAGKLDMAQVWFDQWASGGQNSLSTLFIINLQASYNRKKIKWNNDFEYRYGFIKPGEDPLRKNEDRIKVSSTINYYAIKKWYYGFTVDAQTQFFKGYKYINDSTKTIVSDIISPFYSTAGVGLNYFPIKQLSVFFSPITNRLIFVGDTALVDQKNYGVDQNRKAKNEPGAYIKSNLNWNITKNINFVNKFDLFLRYYEIQRYNFDWELTMTFKFNRLVQASINTHLVYDPNITVKQSDGTSKTPVQFKELLSIGLFYKI